MKKSEYTRNRALQSGSKFSRIVYWFKTLSFVKHIFIFYLFITLIGSLVLWMPVSHKVQITYVDALFTSASAFSDTGLVTMTTSSTWTMFGQAIIAILILTGGIGWFALKVYFFNILFKRPISFATRNALASERGSGKIGITRNIIKVSVTIMFTLIILFSILLSFYFYYIPVTVDSSPIMKMSPQTNSVSPVIAFTDGVPSNNWSIAIRYGVFHTISAINNAGFDIMGEGSISGYYYSYSIQIIFIVLFVIGGIGYPVIYDIFLWVKSKYTGDIHRWTLFTKVSVLTYFTMVVLSISITFLIEIEATNSYDSHNIVLLAGKNIHGNPFASFWNNPDYGGAGDKSMAIIFNTMSTRNAGFSTVDVKALSNPTLLFYSILMFIGSAPSSTAGGIRTTTLAIIILSIWARIRGKKHVSIFGKRIPDSTVTKSFVLFSAAIILVMTVIMISSTSFYEHGGELNSPNQPYGLDGISYSYTGLIFEVSSAFGTTGLSTGITAHISLATKISLIIVMFVGQLGVSSSLLIWGNKRDSKRHFTYVEEEIPIG